MDDLEFVQKCIKGDKASWDAFVEKYSRLIYSCIYHVLHSKGTRLPQETVHDLLQEIFVLLIDNHFQRLKSFKAKNGCTLASWLRQVSVHYTVDYLRKLKPTLSLDEEREDGRSLIETLTSGLSPQKDTLSQEEALSGAKQREKGFVKGPKVLGK